MNANVTPPAVKTKSDNVPHGAQAPGKTEKQRPTPTPDQRPENEREKQDAPKKERAPKKDYGYSKDSIIHVLKPDATFRGQRGEWFERIKQFDGKTCGEFIAANDKVPNGKGKFYAPSGNLRGAARRGVIEMIRPAAPPASKPE